MKLNQLNVDKNVLWEYRLRFDVQGAELSNADLIFGDTLEDIYEIAKKYILQICVLLSIRMLILTAQHDIL